MITPDRDILSNLYEKLQQIRGQLAHTGRKSLGRVGECEFNRRELESIVELGDRQTKIVGDHAQRSKYGTSRWPQERSLTFKAWRRRTECERGSRQRGNEESQSTSNSLIIFSIPSSFFSVSWAICF